MWRAGRRLRCGAACCSSPTSLVFPQSSALLTWVRCFPQLSQSHKNPNGSSAAFPKLKSHCSCLLGPTCQGMKGSAFIHFSLFLVDIIKVNQFLQYTASLLESTTGWADVSECMHTWLFEVPAQRSGRNGCECSCFCPRSPTNLTVPRSPDSAGFLGPTNARRAVAQHLPGRGPAPPQPMPPREKPADSQRRRVGSHCIASGIPPPAPQLRSEFVFGLKTSVPHVAPLSSHGSPARTSSPGVLALPSRHQLSSRCLVVELYFWSPLRTVAARA